MQHSLKAMEQILSRNATPAGQIASLSNQPADIGESPTEDIVVDIGESPTEEREGEPVPELERERESLRQRVTTEGTHAQAGPSQSLTVSQSEPVVVDNGVSQSEPVVVDLMDDKLTASVSELNESELEAQKEAEEYERFKQQQTKRDTTRANHDRAMAAFADFGLDSQDSGADDVAGDLDDEQDSFDQLNRSLHEMKQDSFDQLNRSLHEMKETSFDQLNRSLHEMKESIEAKEF